MTIIEVNQVAAAINTSWRSATSAILATAQLCADADAKFRGAQRDTLLDSLRFGPSTFSKLVTIGRNHQLFRDENLIELLPPSFSIIYEVAKMDPELREVAIEKKVIAKDMKRATLLAFIESLRVPTNADRHSD